MKRNVREHLPQKHWDALSRQLHAAYQETDYDRALQALKTTARSEPWLLAKFGLRLLAETEPVERSILASKLTGPYEVTEEFGRQRR